MALDELKKENDIVIEDAGMKVVYENNLDRYVNNAIVDYSGKWYNKGFRLYGALGSSC